MTTPAKLMALEALNSGLVYVENNANQLTTRQYKAAITALEADIALVVEPTGLRNSLLEALASELSHGAYDCTRVWWAWSVGTMGQDDFSPVTDRLEDIVNTVADAIAAYTAPQEAAEPDLLAALTDLVANQDATWVAAGFTDEQIKAMPYLKASRAAIAKAVQS